MGELKRGKNRKEKKKKGKASEKDAGTGARRLACGQWRAPRAGAGGSEQRAGLAVDPLLSPRVDSQLPWGRRGPAPSFPSLPFPHAWHSGRRRAPQQRAPFRNHTAGSKGGERGGTQPVPGSETPRKRGTGLGVRSEPQAARRGAVLSQPPARSGLAQR